ncbi:HAAS signaling domain-containing protein [Microbacterium sp. P5_E9]
MPRTDLPNEAHAYLRRLDEALVGVPDETAAEIRAGIVEEFAGLDRTAAQERIAQLGDPAFIAAEARNEVAADPAPRKSALQSRGYIITAGLAVAVGIYVIPLMGAVIGYLMVWFSPAWKRSEKLIAPAIPLMAGVVTAAYLVLATTFSTNGTGSLIGGFGAAGSDGATGGLALLFTPLVTFNVLFVISIVNAAVGVWLLIRALRRA